MYFIDPLDTKNTLSKQLKELTGDQYSSVAFHSAHDPSSVTAAGVLVHKETGKQIFVPFKADPKEDGEDRCIEELKRIAIFEEGCGGYQWGDWRNADGNFGGTRLDMLEEFGLAERTGKSARNNMGGSWPEVRVTELGMEVIEAERRKLGKQLNTRALLDNGKISKSILAAAEYAREFHGPQYDSQIMLSKILHVAEFCWERLQEDTPGLENVDFHQGVAWLKENLENFGKAYEDSYSVDKHKKFSIPIAPVWNKEVGTQVYAMMFKPTGKFSNDGIVNMPGAKSYDRESMLKAFRENQRIASKEFYNDSLTVVMQDAPANSEDPLYRDFVTRMTPAADFHPEAKLNQKKGLDNLAP